MSTSVDKIKEMVKEIYLNYGIDTDDMLDHEIGRVTEYYYRNQDKLKKHLEESRKIIKDDE